MFEYLDIYYLKRNKLSKIKKFWFIDLNITVGSDIVCADVRCVVNCNQAQNILGLYRDLVIISFFSTKFQVVMYIPY